MLLENSFFCRQTNIKFILGSNSFFNKQKLCRFYNSIPLFYYFLTALSTIAVEATSGSGANSAILMNLAKSGAISS